MEFEIRKRTKPPDAAQRRRRFRYRRPWGLYRDGQIVGSYATREEAEMAMPRASLWGAPVKGDAAEALTRGDGTHREPSS